MALQMAQQRRRIKGLNLEGHMVNISARGSRGLGIAAGTTAAAQNSVDRHQINQGATSAQMP